MKKELLGPGIRLEAIENSPLLKEEHMMIGMKYTLD